MYVIVKYPHGRSLCVQSCFQFVKKQTSPLSFLRILLIKYDTAVLQTLSLQEE